MQPIYFFRFAEYLLRFTENFRRFTDIDLSQRHTYALFALDLIIYVTIHQPARYIVLRRF